MPGCGSFFVVAYRKGHNYFKCANFNTFETNSLQHEIQIAGDG
jgi:hypothetical protein